MKNALPNSVELFQQAERLYYSALELDAYARRAFLIEACADNEALRREVESLLAAHEQAGSFIAGNAVADQANRNADSASIEDQPTAMLPNPLLNSEQRTINQYRIISMLGRGGMGEVWRAEDTRLKRQVALKLLPAEFTNEAERLRRFEQEALAISALNHPNIITIHEIGESDAGRFIVMELVAGRTLRELAVKAIAMDDLLGWGVQLAQALRAAHAAGITHRDIKPDNLMVRADGYVKVLDFGLARLDDSRHLVAEAHTQSGMLLGTVKYMSPEQARGEKATHATDIFALGLVFYELATGRHPFNATTLLATLQQITNDVPPAPITLNQQLPVAFDALIQRMLAKQARARPTAAEVERELRVIARQNDSATGRDSKAATPITHKVPSRPIAPIVGRETERRELHAAFQAAQAGRGSLLCIAGEPGIGKTTVIETFLAELAATEAVTIARGRCSERLAGTEAYLPILEALENLLRLDQAALAPMLKQVALVWYVQVALVTEASESFAQLQAEVKGASQERVKRELTNFLQEAARQRPLVLFIDDLHWADVSTIDALSYLASRFEAMNVLIVATYRPSDMLLTKHPFLQIKPDLQARGACRELALAFLTEADIAEYLALEFPHHRFPAEFARLIHAKTEGSPLFMADLVRHLRDRSALEQVDGAWTLAQTLPNLERELPESVRGMIERKIAQLSEDDHKLLTAASVQGYEFDSAVVARVLNLDADAVEDRLEKLERVFGFVRLAEEHEYPNRTLTLRYRFVHVLYQNALYEALRVTRKATLSAALAQTLEGFHGAQSATIANDLARLWEAARDYERAADYFLQTASNAAQFNAHREAVQLAERGLAALLKLPERPERNGRELGLQLTLGFSLMSVLSWAAPEAGTAFQRARQLCQQMGDDPRFFAVLNGAASYHVVRAEFGIALELGEQMRQIAEQAQNPAMKVVAVNRLAEIHSSGGRDLPLARQEFEQAIALDRLEYHPSYLLVSNESQGITPRRQGCYCLWMLGYNNQALAMAQEGVTLAEQLSHPFSLGTAYIGTGATHFFLRDWQASQKEFEKVFALAEKYDLGDMLDWAITLNAINRAFQEPTEAALERAKKEVASLRAKGVMMCMTWCLAGLGEACWRASLSEEGLAVIAEALMLVERTGERSFEADIWRVKGELLLQAAADDAQTEAENCFQKGIVIAQSQSAKQFELRATVSLARLWLQQGKANEARQRLAEVYGWFTEGFDTADLKEAKALLEACGTASGSELVAQDARAAESPSRSGSAHRSEGRPSIAVLPFVNISNEADNEYFCDGLAEELLNALAKVGALHVAARTSSFSFKGKETDIREIGQKLNVATVLEGSVRKAGNRLRITAQLINIADGYHLWSERYDRELKDIFDIQDDISLAIVAALKVKLLGAEQAAVTKRYTDNTEAYQLYLMGRFHFSRVTEEGFRKGIAYFEQATAKEPDYALALGGLADAWLNLWWNGYLSPGEGILKTKTASAKALAVDASLAESHVCLAQIKFYYEWDFSGASQEFKQAIALNPNYAEAHGEYGLILSVTGRAEEAEAEAKRSVELDPLSLITNFRAGWIYYALGQSDRVLEYCRKMIEIEPNFFGGYSLGAIEAWRQKQYGQAITEMQTAVALGEVRAISFLGCLYGITGEPDNARQMLGQLQDLIVEQYVPSYYFALVYAGLSELDRAFEYLEQSYEQREAILLYLKFSAALIPGFSIEPRLTDLLRRIGLPE